VKDPLLAPSRLSSANGKLSGETVEYVLRLKGAAVKKVVVDSDVKIVSTK